MSETQEITNATEMKISRGNLSTGPSVPVDLIQVNNDDNSRMQVTEVKELARQIREDGQLQPVIVTKNSDGTYKLIAGFRRVAAIQFNQKDLGEPQRVLIHVINKPSDVDILAINLCENVQRENLTCIEEAKAVRKLNVAGLKQSEISKRIGKSAMWVSQRMALSSLNYSLQMKIHNGEVTMVQGLEFARQTPDQQRVVSEQIDAAKATIIPPTPSNETNPLDGDVDIPVNPASEPTPEQKKEALKAAKAAARAASSVSKPKTNRVDADTLAATAENGKPDTQELTEVLLRGMKSPKMDEDTKLVFRNFLMYLEGTIRDEDEFLVAVNGAILAIKPETATGGAA